MGKNSVKEEFLTLEDLTHMLSRNVSKNQQHAVRNNPQERRPHLHGGESLKSPCNTLKLDAVTRRATQTGNNSFTAVHKARDKRITSWDIS
jgi:hypothetical protein